MEGCWESWCHPGEGQCWDRCRWDGKQGDGRSLISHSNKKSSSKCIVGLFPWDFHFKLGFASPVLGCEGFSLLFPSKYKAQIHAGASQSILPVLLAASHGAPSPCPTLTPPVMLTPPYTHTSLPSIPLRNPCCRGPGCRGGFPAPRLHGSFPEPWSSFHQIWKDFFGLRFSARRPRPKSAAFQMLRSALLFSPPPPPPPSPSLLPSLSAGPCNATP